MSYNKGVRQKIKINFIPTKVGTIMRVGVTKVRMDSMLLGTAYVSATAEKVRCVLWRMNGFPRYVLIGRERGKVLPVLRNFLPIRELTKKEEDKVINYIEVREALGL